MSRSFVIEILDEFVLGLFGLLATIFRLVEAGPKSNDFIPQATDFFNNGHDQIIEEVLPSRASTP